MARAGERTNLARPFYRVVKTDPPTDDDFSSNAAKGKPPRGPEEHNRFMYEGVSVYDQEDRAMAKARRHPALGRHVAELVIEQDAPVVVRRTLREPGRHTIRRAAPLLRSFVRRVRAAQ